MVGDLRDLNKPLIAVRPKLSAEVRRMLEDRFTVTSEPTAETEALLGFHPTLDTLDACPRLRAISSPSAGFDAFDLPELTRRGIALMNAPDALTETVADLAFALLLATARRVVELAECVRSGGWDEEVPDQGFGTDVFGKTLGIVGLGRIGTAVARRGALGFGMRVLYHARTSKPDAEREFRAERRDLDALLRESDFAVVTVPLNDETRGRVGAREIALMPSHAILVNVGRGSVIDEAALVEALREGKIRGAGLDVFEEEPLDLHSPLRSLPNVVALPHLGSATHATRDGMLREAAENLIAFFDGQPKNVVNREVVR